MDVFITILSFFCIGGLFGFILEVFFRRYVSVKRWVKPGFLVGPFIPLYGFGAAILYAFDAYIPWEAISDLPWLNVLLEILSLGIALTLIELIAGLIFVKGMKIRLWDYSRQWGNFMGLICPLFSFFWLLGAALYVLLLSGPFKDMGAFFAQHYEALSYPLGLFSGILLVDMAYSLGIARKLREAVNDPKFVAHWEKTKLALRDYYAKLKAKQSFFLPFFNKNDQFKEAIREQVEELKKKAKAAYESHLQKKEGDKNKK